MVGIGISAWGAKRLISLACSIEIILVTGTWVYLVTSLGSILVVTTCLYVVTVWGSETAFCWAEVATGGATPW